MIKLEDWYLGVDCEDPYMSPERHPKQLKGKVYGHPKHKDGKLIRTSNIKEVRGNVVVTQNNEYVLGKVNMDYKEWCEKEGHHVPTENEPIKEIKNG